MLGLSLENALSKNNTKILLLGAHCDDIELGCGGTILQLIEQQPSVEIMWIVFSSNEIRRIEAQNSAEHFLTGARAKEIRINDFRNGFFPSDAPKIKEYFETLKNTFSPDIIFTHYRQDLHQDHRVVNELTWNTFRDHMILEYEILKYDGDIGNPNAYMPIYNRHRVNKIDSLMRFYESQKQRPWFTPNTLNGLMRIRGVESNAIDEHAEAFYARKLSLI